MTSVNSTLRPLSDVAAQADTALDQLRAAMELLDQAKDRRQAFAANTAINAHVRELFVLVTEATLLRHGGAALRFCRGETPFYVSWLGKLLDLDICGAKWAGVEAPTPEERVLYAASDRVSLADLRHDWGVEDPLEVVAALIKKGSALFIDLEHRRSGEVDEEGSTVTFAPYGSEV